MWELRIFRISRSSLTLIMCSYQENMNKVELDLNPYWNLEVEVFGILGIDLDLRFEELGADSRVAGLRFRKRGSRGSWGVILGPIGWVRVLVVLFDSRFERLGWDSREGVWRFGKRRRRGIYGVKMGSIGATPPAETISGRRLTAGAARDSLRVCGDDERG